MEKLRKMEPNPRLHSLGQKTFQAPKAPNEEPVRKQASEAFLPPSRLDRDGKDAWPTIVFRCAASGSLESLRAEPKWWFESSRGEVKIVLLFFHDPKSSAIHLEKWDVPTVPKQPVSSAQPGHAEPSAIKTHELDIIKGAATEATLTLEFEKIFLRQPKQGENDIVFTAGDLTEYAKGVWSTPKAKKSKTSKKM